MSNWVLNIFYLVAIFISAIIFIRFMIRDAKKYSGKGKTLSKIDTTVGNILFYIDNNLTDNGRLIYTRNLRNRYNINKTSYSTTTHAGMIYALKLCAKEFDLKNLVNPIKLLTKYFVENYIQKLDDGKYIVVSQPEEENLPNKKVKLSSIVMAILGLSDGQNSEIVSGLGEFLLSMQLDSGQFYNYYNVETRTFNDDISNLNFTGDGALGLLNLYDGQQKWLDGAKKGLLFLANKRKDRKEIQFDYSSMLAVEKLLNIPENILTTDEITLLKNDLLKMVTKISTDKSAKPLYIARAIEGLISAYNCFYDDVNLQMNIMKIIDTNIKLLRMAQIQNGVLKGGFPHSTDWNKAGVPQGEATIKMDTIQHALVACVKFQDLFKG